MIETIGVRGAVSPARETLINTPGEGVLQKYFVHVGDHVDAGQVLAVLKSEAAGVQDARSSQFRIIVSPRDGLVLSIIISIGQRVIANQPLLSIGEPDQLEIRAALSLDELEKVQIGMEVDVSAPDQPGSPTKGSISYAACFFCIYPAGLLKAEDQFIWIRFDNNADLSIGDAVEARIYVKHTDDVLWLPPEAIQNLSGAPFVYLLVNNHLETSLIATGFQTDSQIEIISGLDEGQRVFK